MKKFLFFLLFLIGFSGIIVAAELTECNGDEDCGSGLECRAGFCKPIPGGGSTTAKSGPVEVDLKDKGYVGGGLSSVISGVVNLVFMIATLTAFGFLIFGGVEWITSGGDSGKIQSARGKIMQAVIGLVVLASTWAIMNFVVGLLGYDSFEETVENSPSLKD